MMNVEFQQTPLHLLSVSNYQICVLYSFVSFDCMNYNLYGNNVLIVQFIEHTTLITITKRLFCLKFRLLINEIMVRDGYEQIAIKNDKVVPL